MCVKCMGVGCALICCSYSVSDAPVHPPSLELRISIFFIIVLLFDCSLLPLTLLADTLSVRLGYSLGLCAHSIFQSTG